MTFPAFLAESVMSLCSGVNAPQCRWRRRRPVNPTGTLKEPITGEPSMGQGELLSELPQVKKYLEKENIKYMNIFCLFNKVVAIYFLN